MSLKNEKLQFEFYRVADGDGFDIGFTIKGFQFRFINPRKQERAQDRPWKNLKRSDLPEGFLKELDQKRPGFFGDDGLHRRMNENILAFCPTEQYLQVRKELQARREEDMQKIYGKKQLTKDVSTEGSSDELNEDSFKR